MKIKILIPILLLLVTGCQTKTPDLYPEVIEYHKGTDAIVMNFIENLPPNEVIEGTDFAIGLEIRNKGAYDVRGAKISMSGYTLGRTIVTPRDIYLDLEGKQPGFPEGGYEIANFQVTNAKVLDPEDDVPETFKAVATLLGSGLPKDAIFDRVYNNFSESRMRLMGYALDRKLKVLESFHTAYIALTMEEMKGYDFRIGDSEGFVNLPLSIKGVYFSALFLEKDKHIKISFRSKGLFSVNDFSARHFHGGGHLNAAGGEYYGSLDEAIEQFESLLPRYKNNITTDD